MSITMGVALYKRWRDYGSDLWRSLGIIVGLVVDMLLA